MGTFFVLDFRQRPLRKGKWKATKHVLCAATGFPQNGKKKQKKKPLYQKCIDKMVAKELQGYLKDLLSSFNKEIQSTMVPLRSAIKKLEAPSSVSQTNTPSTTRYAFLQVLKNINPQNLQYMTRCIKSYNPESLVHSLYTKLIKISLKKECEDPEKKLSSYQPQSNADPFAETDTKTWAKCPKVDGSLAKVTNKSDLAFDDAGTLSDPMEIRQ
ncbi:hypothetical protein AB205_0084720 [Aquarana catesbeiana]|uniref:Uncharacterized protein n=1 Tax=Aquarana catesbeiana TaxID=8400 RepID=A0A2G9Q9D9_AQUCT|nr:hypothetical protein AB205_0084720 [Aquarana catesbeiana]